MTYMTLEIQILAFDRYKNVTGINHLMRFQLSPLDYWIYHPILNE
jgi:hypothetical protein